MTLRWVSTCTMLGALVRYTDSIRIELLILPAGNKWLIVCISWNNCQVKRASLCSSGRVHVRIKACLSQDRHVLPGHHSLSSSGISWGLGRSSAPSSVWSYSPQSHTTGVITAWLTCILVSISIYLLGQGSEPETWITCKNCVPGTRFYKQLLFAGYL